MVRTLAGELRHVTVHFAVCPGHEASLAKVLVSLVDITERKAAEQRMSQALEFTEGVERVTAGLEKRQRIIQEDEKQRVAYHESGHALVAYSLPNTDPVHKVSIIPRGLAALGYTMQLPVEEKFLSTENELKDQLAILLGGRVAEEIVFDDISSGASNDLERATEIARDMVTRLGMSDELGPLTYGRRQQSLYLGGDYTEDKNYSQETALRIDIKTGSNRLFDFEHSLLLLLRQNGGEC